MVEAASRKAIRRFFEPLLLLDGLGQIRGDRTPPEPPSDGDDAGTSQAARNFADALAYFCAYVKGPDNVTAIALEKFGEQVKVWVAANRSVKPGVESFLQKLLVKVRDIATFSDEGRLNETINSAMDLVIMFNVTRLNEYHKMIVPLVTQLRSAQAGRSSEDLAASQKRRLNSLMTWLEYNFENRELISANNWCGFVRECHKRRESFSILEEIRLPKSQEFVPERLRKLLWKLGKHITLSRRFFDATLQLSWEFSNGFVVEVVPSPPGQKPPLRGQEATVSWTLHRMFSREEEKEQFHRKLQSIHQADRLNRVIHKIRDTQCRVHAELILLDYLHDKGCNFLDPEDKYIAASKPACYLCHAYIKLHPGGFVIPKSHQKSWIGWLPPGVDLETYQMTQRGREMLMKLIEVVRNKLKEEVNDRYHNQKFREDSTVGASSARDFPRDRIDRSQEGIYQWQSNIPENTPHAQHETVIRSIPSSCRAPTVSEGYPSAGEVGSSIAAQNSNKENSRPEDGRFKVLKKGSSLDRKARSIKIIDEMEPTIDSDAEDTEDEEGGVAIGD